MRTLLEIITDVAYEVGMPAPSAVASSSNETAKRLLRMINKEGRLLRDEFDWNKLRVSGSFATDTVNTAQTNVPPDDLTEFSPMTSIWDVANRRPIIGPITLDEWTSLGLNLASSVDRYWIMIDGVLNIQPVSGSADTMSYYYKKVNWVIGDDDVEKDGFDDDNDTPLISDQLLELGTTWRWKKAIGTEYAEDMAEYGRTKEIIYSKERGNMKIETTTPIRPQNIPAGYWPGIIRST